MPEILNILDVSKNYDGIQALTGLTVQFESGAIVGLTGPNGSGKTTLFNLISGFEKPSSGRIQLFGNLTSNLNAQEIARFGVLRTFQELQLFENMSVEDNVFVASELNYGLNIISSYISYRKVNMERVRNNSQIESLLESVNLLKERNRLASHLSHGQRRLLELCRVMITRARLLLLDEPTTGVFPETKIILIDMIKEYRQNTGATIIIIEHNKTLLEDLCDYVLRLEKGQLIK